MKKAFLRIRKAMQVRESFVQYLTFKKVINYLKYENDLKKKKIVTSSFPPVITFQPSGYCNTNCQLCPVGLGIRGPEKGFMGLTKFKKIIDETKDYLIQIAFVGWGEPFLNPETFDMIKYAEKNRILTHASTNLHFFRTEEQLRELLNSGLSFLTISLHGVSQATYEAYQPGKCFSEVINKIETLIRLRKENRQKKPSIEFAFAINKKNMHEVKKMQRFAEDLNVDCDIYTASLQLRFYLNNSNKAVETVKEWAQDTKIDWSDISALEKDRISDLYQTVLKEDGLSFNSLDKLGLTARHFCLDPWRTLTVNWAGSVTLCCTDYSNYSMGNAFDDSLMHIWNNEKYKAVRKYLLGNFGDEKIHFPCIKCIKY